MSRVEDALLAAFTDEVYAGDGKLRGKVARADAVMKAGTPSRSRVLRDNTGCALGKKSNETQVHIRFYSNPPATPQYPGAEPRRDFGSAHAQFANARGSSKGFFELAVMAAEQEF